MSVKLYTKTGDKGKTTLIGGKKVSKSHERIEAYGNVDELNSFIGLLKDNDNVDTRIKHQLYWTQEILFTIGSNLATEEGFQGFKLPELTATEIKQVEQWIDHYDTQLPDLKNFILPGGSDAISQAHICRTVCRRAERSIIRLSEQDHVDANILSFLNRLSDYFFILARKIAYDLQVPETPWKPETL